MKSLVAIALHNVFASTNSGSKFYISTTVQNNDLNQAGFEALTWTQIKGVGSHGETGVNTNMVDYDTWDTEFVQKAKGTSNAGDPEVELARIATDAGQIALRAAGDHFNKNNYAFKIVRNDLPATGASPRATTIYNRGLAAGPRTPQGRNEDFDLEIYMLALQQKQIIVEATAGGTAPEFTALPAVSGTPKVGLVLTTTTGTVTGDATITYSYKWFSGGAEVSGATSSTYTPVTADIGNIIQAQVTATNASGYAVASSNATAVVAA